MVQNVSAKRGGNGQIMAFLPKFFNPNTHFQSFKIFLTMQKVNLSTLSLALSQLANGNKETAIERIKKQCEHLPSGSGIDSGCKIDLNKSTPEKMVFSVPFHHMDENGYYCGWTTYILTVKPSFWQGFEITIKNGGTGLERRERYMVNDTKDYLYDLFNDVFTVDTN